MLMSGAADGKSSKRRYAARNIARDLEHRGNEATNIFRYRPTKESETLSETKMTRPRARALHKSGQNGKSGSGDTIGIRVPSEDALRKIAFNVASASGGRSKKNAQARKIARRGGGEGG